ncbi:MAG: hypothetical protein LWX56_05245 [Ignavibacteria bacterium]|nr:hypothetical protein [Ignavibacteria bacterium]
MKKVLFVGVVSVIVFFVSFSAYSQTEYKTFYENANVIDVVTEGNSLFFATYGQGIIQYNTITEEWKVYSSQTGNAENDFFYCIAVSPDYIWGGASDGLYIYDRKRDFWKKRKFSAGGEYGNWIRALYYDQSTETLWIGRFSYLSRLAVKKQKYDDFDMTVKKDDRTNNFKVIKPDGPDHIWFGCEAGAFYYDKTQDIEDKNSYVFYSNKQNAFRGDGDYVAVSEILSDPNGVWFGTEEFISSEKPRFNIGGLYYFNRKANWQRFDTRTGLPGNGIKALLKTGKKMWVSAYEFEKESKTEHGKGLVMMDVISGKVQKIDLDQIKITTLLINTLSFDGKNLWLGTDKGLWKIKFTNPFAEWSLKK